MFLDKIYHLIFLSDLHATRIILGISEIIWAIALLSPGDTFTRSKTYAGMAQVAPEEYWGILWLFSGIMQLYIVYLNDYHSRGAIWFAGVNALLWVLVVTSLYVCVWPMNAVASADAALAMAAVWIWVRSGWIAKPIRGAEKWM